MNLKNTLEFANKAIADNNYLKAKLLLENEIKDNPKVFELNFKLGLVNNLLGDFKKSINYYEKSILLDPNYSPAFCNLGIIYDKLNNKNLAVKNYLEAIKKDPKNFKAYYNLGNCYLKNSDIENAEKNYYLSIDIRSDNIHPYINLFQIYDRSNNLKKLDIILKKAQNIFHKNPIILFFEGISEFRKNNFQNAIKIFEKLETDQIDISKNIVKNNTLAKCFDNLGMYDDAFKFFEKSNSLMQEMYKDKFEKKEYIKLVDERLNFFSQPNFKKWKPVSHINNYQDPVFLVGFPRSGTTLLDTILRTHDSIKVFEEEPLVDKVIDKLHNYINKDFTKLDEIEESTIFELRSLYFENREKLLPTDKHKLYIDKLPLNIIFIGEINKIFPNSKFILALRNPYDSILSCFMQPFVPNNAMSNFYNLEDAILIYDKIMQLWSFYEEKLDINTHIIKYEEVVNNFDLSISALLKFLEIDWSDKLKEFYKTAEKRGIINTPSYNQINQPLYQKSIDRWKNYKKYFSGLEPSLIKWNSKFNY